MIKKLQEVTGNIPVRLSKYEWGSVRYIKIDDSILVDMIITFRIKSTAY